VDVNRLPGIVADILDQLMNPARLPVLADDTVFPLRRIAGNRADILLAFVDLQKVFRVNDLVPRRILGNKLFRSIAGYLLNSAVKKDGRKVNRPPEGDAAELLQE